MGRLPVSTTAEALALFALVLLLGAFIIWLVSRYRGDEGDDRQSTSGMLTKFRDLHGEGVLSDEEFRTIKTKLSAQLQQEQRDGEEPG